MSDSEKLDSVMRATLDLSPDTDLTGIAYGETESWDSIAHMQMVAAIEDAFGIMLDTDDVIGMSSYHVARQILRDRHGLALDA